MPLFVVAARTCSGACSPASVAEKESFRLAEKAQPGELSEPYRVNICGLCTLLHSHMFPEAEETGGDVNLP